MLCHKISDLRQQLSDKHGVAFTTTTVHQDNIAVMEGRGRGERELLFYKNNWDEESCALLPM